MMNVWAMTNFILNGSIPQSPERLINGLSHFNRIERKLYIMNEKTKQLIVEWYKYIEGTYFSYVVHFLAGFAVATIVGHFVGSLLATMFTCIVGIGKECVDEY